MGSVTPVDGRTVGGSVGYFGAAPAKPTFHAKDHGRDNWTPDVRPATFHDARGWSAQPSLFREGVALVRHQTAVRDFGDRDEVRRVYAQELAELIASATGATRAVGFPFANQRYSPRYAGYNGGDNSQPAHFPHVDVTPATSHGLVDTFMGPREPLEPGQVLVGYNVWRVLSPPPQDMPLAVCDARTVTEADLIAADGVYDAGEPPWPTAEAYLVRHNPAHRWLFFSDMRTDEALIFRAYGNEPSYIPGCPHVGFTDPSCPADAGPRISVEARGYAVFDSWPPALAS
jgi:hypothetical protein